MNHIPKHLPLHDECSGIANVQRELARPMPAMVNRAGCFALGMVVGALIVAALVVMACGKF